MIHSDETRSHHRHGPGATQDFGRAFMIGTALNVGFVLVEVAFGLIANSTALLADAGHNLSDVLGLLAAWGASALARRPRTDRFTYGLRGSTILAALFNAMFLLIAMGAIAWEAVRRVAEPVPVAGWTVLAVAATGVVINGVTAWLFASGREHDLNVRGAFLHMAADAGVSAGVVVAALAILLTGAAWIDAAVSLLIVAVVVWSTWGLLRDSLRLSLAAVPKEIDLRSVREFLERRPGVHSVHDLHVWAMSTTETALTCHLVMPGRTADDTFLIEVADLLNERFGIAHATIQVESDPQTQCRLAPERRV